MRVGDEMGLKDLAVERPEFESCPGHMLDMWQEDPTEPMSCGGSVQSSQAPPAALIPWKEIL